MLKLVGLWTGGMAYAFRESLDRAVLGAWWVAAEDGRLDKGLGVDKGDEDADGEEDTGISHVG